jgi:EAL domain-containing protein (putative c-di-GMP-specific phosphodiesterase class I)
MDDFGTGYSSLSYFRKFSFDTIKIDQSFVRDVEQDPVNLAIVHSLVDLVQKTDRHLVIEGVETASQMRLLQDTGCNIMQGYLFCEPLRTEVITEKLWEWHRLGRFPLPALNDRAGVFRNA